MDILNPGLRGEEFSAPWFRQTFYFFYALNEWISGSWPAAVCEEVNSGKFLFFYALNEWILAHLGWRTYWLELASCPEMSRNRRIHLFSLRFLQFPSKIGPAGGIPNLYFYPQRIWIFASGSPIQGKYSIANTRFLFIFTHWMNEYLEPGGPWTWLGQIFTPTNNIFTLPGATNRDSLIPPG